jgi:thiol-disulfide isomerase/thioredoxin
MINNFVNIKKFIFLLITIVIILFVINNYYISKNENYSSIQNSQDIQEIQKNHEIGNIPTLSFFYTNWCGHCKQFKPEWEKFETIINNSNLKGTITLEKIDCDKNKDKCTANNIKGFPAVLLQKTDGTVIIYSSYPRTAESLLDFIKNN